MNQLSLMLLTDELPDIIYNNTLATYTAINQYGDEGYFLNFLDYLDVMPNFKKHLETYPEYAAYITSPSGARLNAAFFPNLLRSHRNTLETA